MRVLRMKCDTPWLRSGKLYPATPAMPITDLNLLLARLLAEYDPDQPRDPDGKWGSGGGDGASEGATGSDALAVADSAFGQTRDRMTEGERQSLTKYGGGAYREVNAELRGQEIPGSSFSAPVSAEDRQQITSDLDSAFSKAEPISEPVTVYRGVGDAQATFGEEGSTVGKSFTDKAFVSTSTDQSTAAARSHGDTGDKGVVSINVPSGTSTLSPELSANGTRGMAPEYEVLLNRDSGFTVTSDKTDDNGVRQISLDLVK